MWGKSYNIIEVKVYEVRGVKDDLKWNVRGYNNVITPITYNIDTILNSAPKYTSNHPIV